MSEAVEERGRHLGIAEDCRPFAESQVGGDDDRGALVEAANQVEEHLDAAVWGGQIVQCIEHDEVDLGAFTMIFADVFA